MMALTAMHGGVLVTNGQRVKHDILIFYDKTKNGFKTQRWTMNAFAYSLDTA